MASIPLMETFLSIQGEGARAGNPTIFIRVGGCNFKCQGFGVSYVAPISGEKKCGCDTYYAVDKEFSKTWDYLEYPEITKKINTLIDYRLYSKPDICITGGEPTLYWTNPDFQNLLKYYSSRGHHITIETNASIDIELTEDYQKGIAFSMSVKLAVSGEKESKRLNFDNISNILEHTKNSYLKFVVKEEPDIIEILGILEKIPTLANVYLMPLGDTKSVLDSNRLFVIESAIKYGFKFSDRLHIVAWDNKGGV